MRCVSRWSEDHDTTQPSVLTSAGRCGWIAAWHASASDMVRTEGGSAETCGMSARLPARLRSGNPVADMVRDDGKLAIMKRMHLRRRRRQHNGRQRPCGERLPALDTVAALPVWGEDQ